MANKLHEIDIANINTENNLMTVTKLKKPEAGLLLGLAGIGLCTVVIGTVLSGVKLGFTIAKKARK